MPPKKAAGTKKVSKPKASKPSRSVNSDVLVLCGSEDYLLDRDLTDIVSSSTEDTIVTLDGRETSSEEVLESLQQFPMDGSDLVVMVDHAEKLKPLDDLLDFLAESPKGVQLVVCCRSETLPKSWSGVGKVVQRDKLKSWQESKIEALLKSEAEHLGLDLSDDSAAYLVRSYSNDITASLNAVKKAAWVSGAKITQNALTRVSPKKINPLPWEVAELAITGQTFKALAFATLLFAQEGDEAAFPILSSMMRLTERFFLARSLFDQQGDHNGLGQAIGVNPYLYDKNMAPTVSKLSANFLSQKMKRLCEIEIKMKGSSLPKRVLIEIAVLDFRS